MAKIVYRSFYHSFEGRNLTFQCKYENYLDRLHQRNPHRMYLPQFSYLLPGGTTRITPNIPV